MIDSGFRVTLDPWSAEYDASVLLAEAEEPEARVDLRVEQADWARGPAGRRRRRSAAPCFVDGVRRVDHRLRGRAATGGTRLRPARHVRGGRLRVGRAARRSCTRSSRASPASAEGWSCRRSRSRASAAGWRCSSRGTRWRRTRRSRPSRACRRPCARAEARLGRGARTRGRSRLPRRAAHVPHQRRRGAVVGFVKRLLRTYLARLRPARSCLAWRVGERTPALPDRRTGTPLLLVSRGSLAAAPIESALTGVARLETPADAGLDAARALADASRHACCPGFASDPAHDPRAPQNLYPIGGLESRLRRLLGDSDARAARDRVAPASGGRGMSIPVGRVLGTQDAHAARVLGGGGRGPVPPARRRGASSRRRSPTARRVRLFGVVDLVRARHEGAQVRLRRLPHRRRASCRPRWRRPRTCAVTRVEPEIFVPPLPGQEVLRARRTCDRDQALFFDGMERRAAHRPVAATASPSSPTSTSSTARAAPTSTSRASRASPPRRPTPPSCCTACSRAALSAASAANTHALIFNVKGEDLLFLDQPNAGLRAETRGRVRRSSGCPAGPFDQRADSGPGARGLDASGCPTRAAGSEGVPAFFWTLREFVAERLLRFLFAEAEDTTSQLCVRRRPRRGQARQQAARRGHDRTTPGSRSRASGIESFDDLVEA